MTTLRLMVFPGVVCGLAAPVQAQHSQAQARDTAGGAPPVITWQSGPPLPEGRDHHSTALIEGAGGASLVVLGGSNYTTDFGDVWRLSLRPDGTIGSWQRQDSLPARRGGASVAVVENRLVVTGGFFLDPAQPNVPQKTSTTFVARVRPDGSVGDWTAASPLPGVRYHHASVTHGRWVYVTGGIGDRVAEATVFGAQLQPDGTLGEWTALTALPNPRSHHSSFVHAGHLYVVGGLANHPGLPLLHVDVARAEIQADGTLGRWQTVGFTPHAYATHSGFVHGGHLYLVGGVEDNVRFTDAIWRAPLGSDGRVGAWEAVQPGLPAARAHVHNTPVWNGRMYSVGGSASRRVRVALDIGVLPPD